MPTGVALHDPRSRLFAAAERILLRDGPDALTSRSATAEAGVAKGVLHRYFADMDDFLVGLIDDRAAAVTRVGEGLLVRAGVEPVVGLAADGLTAVFQPTSLALIGLISTRTRLRDRVRTDTGQLPILTEAVTALAVCLQAAQQHGRLRHDADPRALAFALVGTGHLLFAGELGGFPDRSAVEEVVEGILIGALPGVAEA